MFDVFDIADEGYNLDAVANMAEIAAMALTQYKSKEAEYIKNILEGIAEDCYGHEPE